MTHFDSQHRNNGIIWLEPKGQPNSLSIEPSLPGLDPPGRCTVVARDSGGYIKGILYLGITPEGHADENVEMSVFVQPAWRREGVATHMMDYAAKHIPGAERVMAQQMFTREGWAWWQAYTTPKRAGGSAT
jgi:GNAT superfamily N-acetyltransferase